MNTYIFFSLKSKLPLKISRYRYVSCFNVEFKVNGFGLKRILCVRNIFFSFDYHCQHSALFCMWYAQFWWLSMICLCWTCQKSGTESRTLDMLMLRFGKVIIAFMRYYCTVAYISHFKHVFHCWWFSIVPMKWYVFYRNDMLTCSETTWCLYRNVGTLKCGPHNPNKIDI